MGSYAPRQLPPDPQHPSRAARNSNSRQSWWLSALVSGIVALALAVLTVVSAALTFPAPLLFIPLAGAMVVGLLGIALIVVAGWLKRREDMSRGEAPSGR